MDCRDCVNRKEGCFKDCKFYKGYRKEKTMSREKQTNKKQKQEYLKYKPFADDLRKAESWCELDGVLNRYQTVKNLSKMGYRKQSDGEWIDRDCITESKRGRTIHYATHQCSICGKWNGRHKTNFCPNCGAKMKGGAEE